MDQLFPEVDNLSSLLLEVNNNKEVNNNNNNNDDGNNFFPRYKFAQDLEEEQNGIGIKRRFSSVNIHYDQELKNALSQFGGAEGFEMNKMRNENRMEEEGEPPYKRRYSVPIFSTNVNDNNKEAKKLTIKRTAKKRLIWTPELHDQFVEAYNKLGEKAVPKTILNEMNVEGITRENIASHLQKYRIHLRKNKEKSSKDNDDNNKNKTNKSYDSIETKRRNSITDSIYALQKSKQNEKKSTIEKKKKNNGKNDTNSKKKIKKSNLKDIENDCFDDDKSNSSNSNNEQEEDNIKIEDNGQFNEINANAHNLNIYNNMYKMSLLKSQNNTQDQLSMIYNEEQMLNNNNDNNVVQNVSAQIKQKILQSKLSKLQESAKRRNSQPFIFSNFGNNFGYDGNNNNNNNHIMQLLKGNNYSPNHAISINSRLQQQQQQLDMDTNIFDKRNAVLQYLAQQQEQQQQEQQQQQNQQQNPSFLNDKLGNNPQKIDPQFTIRSRSNLINQNRASMPTIPTFLQKEDRSLFMNEITKNSLISTVEDPVNIKTTNAPISISTSFKLVNESFSYNNNNIPDNGIHLDNN